MLSPAHQLFGAGQECSQACTRGHFSKLLIIFKLSFVIDTIAIKLFCYYLQFKIEISSL